MTFTPEQSRAMWEMLDRLATLTASARVDLTEQAVGLSDEAKKLWLEIHESQDLRNPNPIPETPDPMKTV